MFLVALTGKGVAQERPDSVALAPSDTLFEIRLADGSTLFGRVIERADDQLVVETTAGVRIELTRAQISSIQPLRGRVVEGQVWVEDPNTSRLFFGPTARTVAAGEGYFGMFELFFPYISVGATESLTIAGGMPVVPGLIGQVVYLAPKARLVSADRLQVAAGVLALFATEELDAGSAGILYGVGTYGTPDDALTGGIGWAFAGDDLANRPVLMLGGESRLSRRVKLITENYLILYEDEEYDFGSDRYREETRSVALLSGGFRFFGERLSADAGLGFAVGDGESGCCLPVVNFIYNFGRQR